MRPDMNGAVGTIFGWDQNSSLWKVRMADGAGKMLKSSNMELVNAAAETNPGDDTAYSVGQSVRVVGLKRRKDLNGLEGTIVEWDTGHNGWKVKPARPNPAEPARPPESGRTRKWDGRSIPAELGYGRPPEPGRIHKWTNYTKNEDQ